MNSLSSRLVLGLGLAVSILVSPISALAELQTVVTITSNAMPGTMLFQSDTNSEDSLTGAIYTDTRSSFRQTVTLEQLASPNGAVLLHVKGHDVIVMKTRDLHPRQGGKVIVDFLKNGITGSRGRQEYRLTRDGNRWQLYAETRNGLQAVNFMHFVKNTVFGRLVGIQKIQVR